MTTFLIALYALPIALGLIVIAIAVYGLVEYEMLLAPEEIV